MRIVEDSPARLVLRDRTLWTSWVCFGAALLIASRVVAAPADLRPLISAALASLFGLAFLRSTDAVFDKSRRTCLIRRRDMLRVTRRTIGFDEIADVLVDTMADADAPGHVTCRLTLSTAAGRVPLTATYEPDADRHRAMRDALVAALFAGRAAPAAADPVRALVAAGRTIDAIALLRSRDGLGLVEARDRALALKKEIAA